jgi:serine/threonine-protein kinase
MLVGQQFGPFTIDKELGSGAMGTVYRGRYTKTGQVMAIKIMSPGIGATNAAAVDRFEREIVILKQLNHPNIVRFHGAGKQQKMRYFAMEYIEGESLDKVMSRRGRMTWEEVVELGKQLCAALQHAHEQGIIHRDLKPSNIMVLPDGTLKLTDFGIAKDTDLEALTSTNCTVGTASYMSPEQCKGQTDLTHKSDLYSMGVLFYELATGRKPFTADSAMDMFVQHVQGTFERPSRIVLDMPVWMDTLICQLLEKKPEQRPLDAKMVATTLGSIQEKIEAQQSAGVEAVRRRLIDRAPGQKRVGEEDKEAARLLMTGKGKAKRKQVKKPLYQKVWFQALGLLLALGVAGTLLYLVFRPPSADKLYEQAKKAWESRDAEVRDQAIEPNGAIGRYIKHYGSKNDDQAKEVRSWDEQINVEQKERLIDKYLQKLRSKSPLKFEAQGKAEEEAFAAAKAEEEGERAEADKHWRQVKEDGSRIWGVVADRHLKDLAFLPDADKLFQQAHDAFSMGKEIPFRDPQQQKAFDAWRAEHSQLHDVRLAHSLLKSLKEEPIKDPKSRWLHVYTTCNYQRLDKMERKSEEEVKKDAEMLLADMGKHQGDFDSAKVRLFCQDILALYKNDESMKPLVKQAEELLMKVPDR